MKPNRVLLIFSIIILTIQLFLVIFVIIQLYVSKKQTDRHLTFLKDQFLERAFELNKLSFDTYQIISFYHQITNQDLDLKTAKEKMYQQSLFLLGHRAYLDLPLGNTINLLLQKHDPLFIKEQHQEIRTQYLFLLNDFQVQLSHIKTTDSEEELQLALDQLMLTTKSLQAILNQLNNVFSNLTSHYLSFNRQQVTEAAQQFINYVTLVSILSLLSIGSFALFFTIKIRSDAVLRENEQRLRLVSSNYPAFISIIDKHFMIQFASGRDYNKDIVNPRNFVGKSIDEVFGDQGKTIMSHLEKAFNGQESTFEALSAGKSLKFLISPLKNDKAEIQQAFIVAENVSKQKQVENQIKKSLKEKEVLIQEIHHRVKNNMQVIASLLKLQSDKVESGPTRDALTESYGRVYSMASVHEILYGSDNLAEIDLKGYLSNLTAALFDTYKPDKNKISFDFQSDDISLDINLANPLGLILNELISNALKYAFPNNRSGKIKLRVHKINESALELIVKDNGVGFPEDFDLQKNANLGLQLVQTLVENQLGGSLELEATNGTQFTMKFNLEAQ